MGYLRIHLVVWLFLLGSGFVSAQSGVSINDQSSSPDPSAQLDVDSDAKGVLIPRMNGSQMLDILSPAHGLTVFRTDGPGGYYYNAGSPDTPVWVPLVSNPASEALNMGGFAIENLASPIAGSDAVTKDYVDNAVSATGGGTAWDNFQRFTSSGNFIVPEGVTKLRVWVTGAGGGGGGSNSNTTASANFAGGGGGGGGYSEGIFSVTPGDSYEVIVGGGGTAGGASANGGTGGPSSFGSLISATGGQGGYGGQTDRSGRGGQGGFGEGGSYNTSLGAGGTGGRGSLDLPGQPGGNNGGTGGASDASRAPGGGGAGPGGGSGGLGGGNNGSAGRANSGSGGGGGGSNAGGAGGIGGSGSVVVFW